MTSDLKFDEKDFLRKIRLNIKFFKARWEGWYTAIHRSYISINLEIIKEGGRLRPMSEYREMVYVAGSGQVYGMFFSTAKSNGKLKWKPVWQESDMKDWYLFEPVMVKVGTKIKRGGK